MKSGLRKSLTMVLILITTVLFVSACDSNTSDSDVYKIGICQLVQHESLDAATKGFQDALTEKLGDKVEFDLQNAAGDTAVCSTIVNQFVVDEVDLVMTNATQALQAAMAATADLPIVATSVTDFAKAIDVEEWTGVSGINVTGTSDLAPLDQQAAMVRQLLPEAKTVGILYCSAEVNSEYQVEVITDEFIELGFDVKLYTIADTNEISSVTMTACDEVDCLFIPTDNSLAITGTAVHEIAYPAGVPVVASEIGICKGCGIATLSIDYYDLGYEAGLMAYEILENGADPAEMEIRYPEDLTKGYVAERMEYFNIEVPEDYEQIIVE